LSRRGYVATLTLRNIGGIDILASNADATKTVGIQVKTKSGTKAKWLLGEKAEQDSAENLCYVFVILPPFENKVVDGPVTLPEYYIVPHIHVAEYIRKHHQAWLAEPWRDGKPHGDTNMRVFRDEENQYRDRWQLLGLD
jgi:hypothetical protein